MAEYPASKIIHRLASGKVGRRPSFRSTRFEFFLHYSIIIQKAGVTSVSSKPSRNFTEASARHVHELIATVCRWNKIEWLRYRLLLFGKKRWGDITRTCQF